MSRLSTESRLVLRASNLAHRQPGQIGSLPFTWLHGDDDTLTGTMAMVQSYTTELSFGRTKRFVGRAFLQLLRRSPRILKAYYAARGTQHKKPEAVMTVFIDRVVGLFACSVVTMIAVYIGWGSQRRPVLGWLEPDAWGAAPNSLSFWEWTDGGRKPGIDEKVAGEFIERLSTRPPLGRSLFFAAALSMVLNVFCVLQVLALADGLNLHVSKSHVCHRAGCLHFRLDIPRDWEEI